MNIYDMHSHSYYSEDCDVPMDEMCLEAIKKNLKAIAFTEHVDFNRADKGYGYFQKEEYFKGIEKARKSFGNKLEILAGMEFSEPHQYPDQFEKMAEGNWDVIIGSIHMLDEHFVGEPIIKDLYTNEQLYNRYFEDMKDMVKWGQFDLVGHFDFPKRYHGEPDYDFMLIDAILEIIIEKGIAIEINTSPLRKAMDFCSPDIAILKRYRELGGERITIGADAHQPDQIGTGFHEAHRLISQFPGFKVGYFKERVFKEIKP